jgi:dolichol-phosphate mannosyltransferase
LGRATNPYDAPVVSVVVPACNEEDNIVPLLERLAPVLSGLGASSEVIIVDDGSRDGTWREITRAAQRWNGVRGLRLSRNFGHQHALLAGVTHARGRAVITMDADLQHPPEVIPDLFERWCRGARVVQTVRADAHVTSAFKRLTSRGFYRVFSALSGVPMHEGSSDFRLLDRSAVAELLRFDDVDLFLRGAVQWLGMPTETVSFDVAARTHGTTKYGLRKMLGFAGGALVGFSDKPLLLGIWLGFMTGVFAVLELVYVVVQHFRGETVPGWASIVGIVSLLFAVQFVVLGILGVYLARVHRALQHRPRFVVVDTVQPTVTVERVSV